MSSKYKELASISPYFDDFQARDNFMRILFNPSRAVQARELTQLQTILHNQSNQVAKHLFQNNTTISGARISTTENKPGAYLERFAAVNAVTLDGGGNPTNYNTDPGGVFEGESAIVFDETWVGVTFGNGADAATSDKQITITQYDYAVDAGQSYPIIYYEFSGTNAVPGEIFTPLGDAVGSFPDIAIGLPSQNVGGLVNVVATDDENPFKAMAASCAEGIIYSQDHFLTVSAEEIIASNSPSNGIIEIGYRVVQDIVTENNTEQVLADELDIDAGTVPLGNKLRDPASGSRNFNAPGAHRFRVKPTLYAIEYADEGARAAKIAELEASVSSSFSEEFEPFIVIDNGRVVKDQSEVQYADILKLLARRTFDESGNYTVDDFDLSLTEDPDDPTKFVAEIGPGKAYVKGFEINKKVSTRLSIDRARDTRIDTRKVKTIGALPYFVLKTQENSESGFEGGVVGGPVGENWFKIEEQEQVYILNKAIDPAAPVFPAAGDDEVIATTKVISIDRDNDFVRLYLEDVGDGADEIQNAKSIISIRSGGTIHAWVNLAQRRVDPRSKKTSPIFGGDIRPLMVKLNDKIVKETSNHRYQVVERIAVTSNGSGQITINLPAGQEFKTRTPFVTIYREDSPGDLYEVVDVSNLVVDSFASNAITVSGGGITVNDDFVAYVRVERVGASADPVNKSLGTTKTATFTVNEYGKIDGVETDEVLLDEDLYDIIAIYQTSNLATTNATGDTEYKLTTDDLLRLTFDDGQTDVHYGRGKVSDIRKLWRLNKLVANDPTNYRIEYRSFNHATPGRAFTVNSYEFAANEQHKIPRYKSDRFGRIDLINCIDFRQTETNLSGSVTRCILPLSTFEMQEEYYVGRIDIIALNKSGEFVVYNGVPSDNPTPPNVPKDAMILFKLHIPPYTFSTRDIQIEAHKNTRYTMKDIARLEDRIERLEDSVSLSLLEKNAMDMRITDPATGFDRFKSGIFVDNFEGLSHAETTNGEFYISVDRVERTIHCPVEKNNISMTYSMGTGTTQYDNLVTLTPDGTQRIVAQNQTATGTVNLNPYLFYTWVGTVTLNPAVDTWHETRYLPQRNVTVGTWDPPPGFDPNWRIDDIEVNWVGVSPDPNPLPPAPAPTQTSQLTDPVRQTDIQFASQAVRELMLLLAEGTASQAELDIAAARASEELEGNWRIEQTLTGGALAVRNETGIEFDIDQELISQAIRAIGFDGDTGTSTSLGSENVLSGSDAGAIATQIGGTQFDSSPDLLELSNQTTQAIGDRLVGNTIANDNVSSGVGNQSTNQNTAIQQQTIVEVRDVLSRHTTTSAEDRVIDRSEVYWMRENEIEFEGEGFRPGMLVSGYLDNKKVELVPMPDYAKDVDGVTRTRVDSTGKVKGYFKIPARTFTTGKKVFLLIDDEETSQGSTEFTSQGSLTTRQETITTTRSVSTRQVVRPQAPLPDPTAPDDGIRLANLLFGDFIDPLAQSFIITTEGGCMVSSLTAYFATKAGDFRNTATLGALGVVGRPSDDQTLAEALAELYPGQPKDPLQYVDGSEVEYNAPVSVYIVEMRDGTPTSNIVPLSFVTKEAATINSNPFVPEEGETEFVFNDPIYLEQGGEYAFILITTSKEYNVWMTELGQVDIFDGTEGVGVAEQPYLGSLFKSQNNSTWTPEQNQTLTFKLKRYSYTTNSSGTVTFVDSKNLDTLSHNELGVAINQALYSPTFTGDPNDESTFVSTIFPMFGELALNGTGITWNHQFSTGSAMPMYNNKRNALYNSTYPTNEYIIDDANDYTVVASLSTTKDNLSPIIDTQQSRAIAIRNLVKGIETYDGAPLLFVDGDIPGEPGVTSGGATFNQRDVFKTDADNAYVVMQNGTTFTVGTDVPATFATELSDHIASGAIIPANELGIEVDENEVGNAGVYVSKPISLKSPADDIRLIMDSSEPGLSYIKPYYRILNHKPRYIVMKEETDDSENFRISDSMEGQTERVLYVDDPIGLAAGTALNFLRADTSGNENFISINGFDTKNPSGNEQKVAYFSGLTDNAAFDTANTLTRGVYAFCTSSAILKRLIDNGDTVPVWDGTATYVKGDVVYHGGAFWVSSGYVGGLTDWSAGLPAGDHEAGDIVNYQGTLYINKTGTNTADNPIVDTVNWKELSSEYYGVGTVPTDPGTAWSRLSSIFFKQSQSPAADDASQWRPMVLKTGRFDKNDYTDNSFYESTWVPKTDPGIEFSAFAVKLEFITQTSRASVPRAKNLRVIASL